MTTTLTSKNAEVLLANYATGNPFFVNAGTTISNTSPVTGVGIYGNTSAVFTLTNAGSIYGYSVGLALNLGGLLGNSGTISGRGTAVEISGGAGTVINSGHIVGETNDAVILENGGSVSNSGTIVGFGHGVALLQGGSVINSGTIQTSLDQSGSSAVTGVGGATTLFNEGVVYAGVFCTAAVDIAGGYVENTGTLEGQQFEDVVGGAVGVLATASATVRNFGTITAAYGVVLQAGGLLRNEPDSVIESGFLNAAKVTDGTITNYGVMKAEFSGVSLINGGYLINGAPDDETAQIEGIAGIYGTSTGAATTIFNFGSIVGTLKPGFGGSYGIKLQGGFIENGSTGDGTALVSGYTGIEVTTRSGDVFNFATVAATGLRGQDGVLLEAGGYVKNGDDAWRAAVIEGSRGVDVYGGGTVINYGLIEASAHSAIRLAQGGQVINGHGNDPTAMITGYYGIAGFDAVTVTNYGAINSLGSLGGGVTIDAGTAAASGAVTNGGGADRSASIVGATGVFVAGSASVTNFGTIDGQAGAGVTAQGGGVVNGAGSSVGVLIEGVGGVAETGSASVSNMGVIDGSTGAGVSLAAGGTLANGGGLNRAALIEGAAGVVISGAAGAVRNLGTIAAFGGFGAYGVALKAGGTFTNGSATNAKALVEGYGGLQMIGGSAANLGAITAVGDSAGAGVNLSGAARLTNGAAGHAGARIEGYTGVQAGPGTAATVTNFGVIEGDGGTAVKFGSAKDVLNVEAGSSFVGRIVGGGGTLDLASGTGTLAALTGGSVTVSGSMAATTFGGFATIDVGAGASFSDAGSAAVGAGQILETAGSLTLAGPVANAGILEANGAVGSLTAEGAVTGTGHVRISGGATADFGAAFNEPVVFFGSGGGTLELAKSQTYKALIQGFSTTGKTTLDLGDIAFASGTTKATFAGTTTSGTLTVTDGTHTAKIRLAGNFTASSWVLASDKHGGTLVHDPAPPGAAHAFAAAAAAFSAPAGAAQTSAPTGRPLLSWDPGLASSGDGNGGLRK